VSASGACRDRSGRTRGALTDAIRAALGTVVDPELDQPITDLGFVRSIALDGGRAEVHLRLPTSFCAPNFAWLMVADARDAVAAVPGVTQAVIELDDHHDSDLINRGLAAGADYRGTFGPEAEDSLDELRAVFQRKAHTAAMERAVTGLLRAGAATEASVGSLTLGDLPDSAELVRTRAPLGLPAGPAAPVLLQDDGTAPPDPQRFLRRARSVRISVEGNAHFCRGLLATRYPGAEHDQAPLPEDRPVLPLLIGGPTR
jgi:metal-sulfur cluster biosynthetic enzyme